MKSFHIKKFLFVGIFIYSSTFVFGQSELKNDSTDTIILIESYSDNLGLYAYGISKFSNFEIKESRQKSDSVFHFTPNGNLNFGLGFSYKWLGFGAAFNSGAINNDEALKGKTNSLDLQLDVFTRRMIFNANFQYYKGYYWENPEVFYPNWNKNDSLVVRSDISTITFGLNGIYIFNHKKFSFKAVYSYSERQLKSAGSLLLGSRFSFYGINADSSIVPAELQDYFPNSTEIGSLSSISMGASFGYT